MLADLAETGENGEPSAAAVTIGTVSASNPTVASLYAGAGGLDLGFITAGFEIQAAVECDRHAVATYRSNVGPHIELDTMPGWAPPSSIRPDVVIGGPPCQGFSVMGRMAPDDPRSQHVFAFLDFVELLSPRAFVLENVKALGTSARWEDVRARLIRRAADDLDYQVFPSVFRATDFGVPQARDRFFLIGLEKGLRWNGPVATTPGRPPTVREALATLPPLGQPGNDTLCRARVVPARRPIVRAAAYSGSLLFNGSGRPLDLDAPAKTLPASMSGNATPIIDQDELDRGASAWVTKYHSGLMNGSRPLVSAPARMRRITVEEAAALQTFPQHSLRDPSRRWKWHGPQSAKYRQVGNAVPPLLAFAVARAVLSSLDPLASGEHDKVRYAV